MPCEHLLSQQSQEANSRVNQQSTFLSTCRQLQALIDSRGMDFLVEPCAALATNTDECTVALMATCTRHRKLVTGSESRLSVNIETARAPDHVHRFRGIDCTPSRNESPEMGVRFMADDSDPFSLLGVGSYP